ncbi:MAG: STAS domain-containing protein [Candidatus Bathyarchaeota archaeon]
MEIELAEIRTPVVEVWQNVILVSIVGTLDTNRAGVLMEALLMKIVDKEAKVVILDLDGVPLIDTTVAKHIMDTIAAAKLMGPEVIVSGINPEVAKTMVKLKIRFEAETYSVLRRAMESALKLLGYELTILK